MPAIVRFLNSQPLPNPESPRGLWNINWVSRTLRNTVYVGEIAWGRTKTGYYDHYDGPVLRSGVEDCGPARHKPLIERGALDQRIKALTAQLEALPRTTVDPLATEALHARLAGADLAGRIASAQADGDTLALRDLLAATVQSAYITERRGGARNGRTAWVRAEVTWTPQVELFLEHG